MSDEDDLRAEIERLRAKVEVLKANNKDRIRLQVSVKGALSLYGIRRFKTVRSPKSLDSGAILETEPSEGQQ